MLKNFVTLVVLVILGVSAEITNYDDVDFDSVLDDLFNNFYDNVMGDKKESKISDTKGKYVYSLHMRTVVEQRRSGYF